MVTICPGTQSESDSGIEESSEKISDLQNGDVSLQNPNNLLQHQVQNELTEKQLERYGVAIKEGLDNALAVIRNGNAVERSQTSGASSDDDNVSGTLSETSFQGGEMSLEPSLVHKPGTKHEVNAYDCNNFHVGDLVKNKVIVKCVVGTPNQESQESSSRESIENSQKKLGTITKAVAVGVSLTLILVVVTVALLVTQLGSSKGKSTYKIFKPAEWGALPSKYTVPELSVRPPKFVIVGSTDGPACSNAENCLVLMKNIQINYMSEGAADVRFNFFVGGDANVYEGLGWDKAGNHTPGYDGRSIGLAFIGDFMVTAPPESQVDAGLLLLESGVMEGKLDAEYVVYVQKQVTPYESPGVQMIPFIRRWQHWSNDVTTSG